MNELHMLAVSAAALRPWSIRCHPVCNSASREYEQSRCDARVALDTVWAVPRISGCIVTVTAPYCLPSSLLPSALLVPIQH